MKILSLFDGISCGRIALDRAGIQVEKYFASEIEKFPIQASEKNYPDIVHIGDVKNVKFTDHLWYGENQNPHGYDHSVRIQLISFGDCEHKIRSIQYLKTHFVSSIE